MNKRKILLSCGLFTALSLGTIGFSSCDKHKDPVLQNYQNVNLHLSKFSLTKEITSKKDGQDVKSLDPTIGNTFFSIQSRKGEGLIMNTQPLPYNTDLKDIRLNIEPKYSDVKVEVSTNDGQDYKLWKKSDKKSFNLEADKLKIRLSYSVQKNNQLQAKDYSYTYKVKIVTYKFNPQTIFWKSEKNYASDVLSGKKNAISYMLSGGQMMLMTADDVAKKNQFFELSQETKDFKTVTYTALPTDSYFVRLVNNKDQVFAITDKGDLYQLTDKTCVALGVKADNLLGVLEQRRGSAKPSLALIVKENEHKYFAEYSLENKQLQKGERINVDFPQKSFYSLSDYRRDVGSSLTLVGLAKSPEGVAFATYETTNALAWAEPNVIEKKSLSSVYDFAFVRNRDISYRFEVQAKGLMLYTRKSQEDWIENEAVAFLPEEGASFAVDSFVNSPILVWVSKQYFYLYRGGANAELYRGELKMDSVN